MARNTRPYVVLGVLMAVLAVLLYRSVPWSGILTGSGSAIGQTPPSGPPAGAVPDVVLDRLEAGRPDPGDGGRNPFEMRPWTPSPPPPADSASPVPVSRPEGGGVVPAPSGPAPPAPIPLKFIGIVHRGAAGKLAVLSDGMLVFYGREREIIDGRYRIVGIGEESIEVEYADGRGRQVIRLTGGS